MSKEYTLSVTSRPARGRGNSRTAGGGGRVAIISGQASDNDRIPIAQYYELLSFKACMQSLIVPCDADDNEMTWADAIQQDEEGNMLAKSLKAKLGLWSPEYLSALGRNPQAGEIIGGGGATTLGGLDNVADEADAVQLSAKILVCEAAAAGWSLKNLSDVVGLNTEALGNYLSVHNYAKKSDIPSLAGYATETWVNAQGFLKGHQSLEDYATKTWVNEQGFLKQHQSLADYVTLNTTQTISASKTFTNKVTINTGMIYGESPTDSHPHGHAIHFGHGGADHMDFYEYGGVWNFYKSQGLTDTLIASLTESALTINAAQFALIYSGLGLGANLSGNPYFGGSVASNGQISLGRDGGRWGTVYAKAADITADVANGLVLKRLGTSGGAFADYYAANCVNEHWRVGMAQEKTYRFVYRQNSVDYNRAELDTAGNLSIQGRMGILIPNMSNGGIPFRFLTITDNGSYGLYTRIHNAYGGYPVTFQAQKEGSTSDWQKLRLNPAGGNVGVNVENPSYPLDVGGAVHSSVGFHTEGYATALKNGTSSDVRLKDIVGDAVLPIEALTAAPSVMFRWKCNGEMAVGTIAQYWQKWLPSEVMQGDNGYLSLSYGTTALVSVINLARYTKSEIELAKEEIKRLKERIVELEKRIV